ncbi:MAG: acyl-CoA dehydrogenase family protein [Pyrinomonadaceae bacterium]
MDAQMEKDFIKGGAFLIEDRTASEIFTPEDLTEEQRMIGETTREFVDSEVRPVIAEMEKHNWQMARELIVKAGELGLLGANIPEEYGGLGTRPDDGRGSCRKYGARRRFRRRLRRANFDRAAADSLFRLAKN